MNFKLKIGSNLIEIEMKARLIRNPDLDRLENKHPRKTVDNTMVKTKIVCRENLFPLTSFLPHCLDPVAVDSYSSEQSER